MGKLTVSEIRQVRRYSRLTGASMPSEIAIDVLLDRIDHLESALNTTKTFLEEEGLTIGAGFSSTYAEVCSALAFQDGRDIL